MNQTEALDEELKMLAQQPSWASPSSLVPLLWVQLLSLRRVWQQS
jgi:hypothetical protein